MLDGDGVGVIQRCEPISATAACCLSSALRQTLRLAGSAERAAPRPSATLLAIFRDWLLLLLLLLLLLENKDAPR